MHSIIPKHAEVDHSDMFVAINNENYLWSTPYDVDLFENVIDFRMLYMKFIMKDRLDDPRVYDFIYEEMRLKTHAEDERSRLVIVPDPDSFNHVKRKIKDYLKKRKVK